MDIVEIRVSNVRRSTVLHSRTITLKELAKANMMIPKEFGVLQSRAVVERVFARAHKTISREGFRRRILDCFDCKAVPGLDEIFRDLGRLDFFDGDETNRDGINDVDQ